MDSSIVKTEYNRCNIGLINYGNCIIDNNKLITIPEPNSVSLPTLTEIFVGRDDELTEIRKFIFAAQKEHKIVVVSGFSGIGKSEFVKRFVFEHKDQCNILWINAESKHKITESFKEIFDMKNYSTMLVKSHCKLLKKRTFIVFDNAPNRKEIRNYEVYSENVHYIITSNNENWGSNLKVIKLDVLTEEAALQIFKHTIKGNFKEEDEEIYKNIAKLVGYIPLTLQVVACYLYEEICALSKTFTLQDYLVRLKKAESDNFAITGILPEYISENYEKSFCFALNISIESIKNKKSKLALDIINTCAFLFSNKIKFKDFLNIPYYKNQLDKNYISESDIKRACNLLRNYCLININSDEDFFGIHNLIQKTLIYHQNSSSIDKDNVYFYYNLEILLDVNDTAESHRNFILDPTFNTRVINTFRNFVTDYYRQIKNCSGLCINLIFCNSHLYLKEVFNKMGHVICKDYINNGFLLHQAVACNHCNIVELIINYGADINLKINYNKNVTPLMWATYNINLKIIKLIINKKCEINTTNCNNANVLFYLMYGMGDIKNRHKSKEALEILRLLVKREAHVMAQNLENESLLHVAARILNIKIVKCLVHEYKLDVNGLNKRGETPIFYISDAEDTDRKRRLMTAKILIRLGTDLEHKNIYGETAADAARRDGAEYLYDYYTSTNHDQDFTDVEENPQADELLRAVSIGDLDAVRHLYEKLGEQAAEIAQACEAPHQAILYKEYEILKFFLHHGVPVDSRRQNNNTLLHTAAEYVNIEAIKILVDQKADLTLTDTSGSTVLFNLIANVVTDYDNKACDIVKWLVEKGADPKHVDNEKSTLIHIAARVSSARLLRYLVQDYGLDINAVNIEGTALHTSILYKNMSNSEDMWWETVRCLLELGARLDIRDKDEKTPVEVAREKNLSDIANILEIYQVVADGDVDALQRLFDELGEQATQFPQSCELPHQAVRFGNYEILEFFLDHGIPVDSRGQNNMTVLHIAAQCTDFEAIQILIGRGADLAAIDNNNWTVLFHLIFGVAQNYDKEVQVCNILKWLVQKDADPKHIDNDKSTLVHAAAYYSTPRIVRCLVQDCGLNVNAVSIYGTALHIAIIHKNESHSEDHWWETVRCLLNLGARLDSTDEDRKTPVEVAKETNLPDVPNILELYQAMANSDLNVFQHLFEELGEQVARFPQSCEIPHQAVRCKEYEILEFLLDHGVLVDSRGQNNRTILHVAAACTDFKAIKILIGRGADPNAIDNGTCSVLFYLIDNIGTNYDITNRACDILKWLVDKGADAKYVNNDKSTLMHAAAQVSSPRILRCLVKDYDLNVNAVDIEGTALHVAILYKNVIHSDYHWWRTVRCLLNLGARLDITNEDGKTPADVAKEENLPDVVNILEIYQAVADGNLDALQHLFEELGKQAIEIPQYCEVPHQAVRYKRYDILEFLLDHGVPVDSRGENNRTILHIAAECTDINATEILVNRGADPRAIDNKNWPVLFYLISGSAMNYDKEDQACNILKWLIEKGADPKHINKGKSTLVHAAAYLSTPRLLRCLVEDYGLNVNSVDIVGTALHVAIVYKNKSHSDDHWIETVRCLLDLGARIDITNKDGKTPVEVAKERNLPDVADFLTTFVVKNNENDFNLNNIEPKNLSPGKIVKLLIKYLKHTGPEQQENYKKIILKENIHGETMLEAANDGEIANEIIELLKLPYGNKRDFKILLQDMKKRQQEIDNKCVIPERETEAPLPNITQTNNGVAIGFQHNAAYETQIIQNASNFHDGEKECKIRRLDHMHTDALLTQNTSDRQNSFAGGYLERKQSDG